MSSGLQSETRSSSRAPAFTPALELFADTRSLVGGERGLVDAALFGARLDLTESFRSGAADGPSAVRAMSPSLEAYSPLVDRDMSDLDVIDLGDLGPWTEMERALADIADAAEFAKSIGRMAVMIGGEHTVSLGSYRGIRRRYPDAMLVQLDAHLDFRTEYEGQAITHASWVYHAGEEFGFENIIQLGVRSGEREEWPRARRLLRYSSEDLTLPKDVLEEMRSRPVYLTIDIDVLDPAAAPGTGCPEPGGATFREVLSVLRQMKGLSVVGMDVVEVFPGLDLSGITAAAAAKLVREAVLGFVPETDVRSPE